MKSKKIITLALAAAMVCTSAVSVYAAELTNTNQEGQTEVKARIDGSVTGDVTYVIEIPDVVDFGTLTMPENTTEQQLLDVHVFSFGFKHGMPAEADLMIDVRFLPNPFYDPEMRTLTGNDEKVATYVLGNDVTKRFLEAWRHLLDVVMPGYVAEGKSQLSIAVGCTGGQHRSVAIANVTADYLTKQGYHVTLSHRNLPHGASAR